MEGAMIYMVLLLLQVFCLVKNAVGVQFQTEVGGMGRNI
jgi:hypothetical protein